MLAHDQHESGIASGALVYDSEDRVLLVQRAAHDSHPNCCTFFAAIDTELIISHERKADQRKGKHQAALSMTKMRRSYMAWRANCSKKLD